jgi:hypothetical protein
MTLDFKSPPHRIVGAIAIASIAGGVIVGLAVSLFQFSDISKSLTILEIIQNTLESVFILIFISFLAGMVIFAPILIMLKHFHFGGPTSAQAVCVAICLYLLGEELRFMLIAQVTAVICTYIFCKYAYPVDRKNSQINP